jgi:hypothetical protein
MSPSLPTCTYRKVRVTDYTHRQYIITDLHIPKVSPSLPTCTYRNYESIITDSTWIHHYRLHIPKLSPSLLTTHTEIMNPSLPTAHESIITDRTYQSIITDYTYRKYESIHKHIKVGFTCTVTCVYCSNSDQQVCTSVTEKYVRHTGVSTHTCVLCLCTASTKHWTTQNYCKVL